MEIRPQLFVILAVTLSVTGTEYGRRLPTELKAFLQLGSSNTVSANDYSASNTWLCRPGIKGACDVDMTTTVVAASGALTSESWKSNANALIDCFYVYPTVSTDPTPNSDMNPDAAELNVIRQQLRASDPCAVSTHLYIVKLLSPDSAHSWPAEPPRRPLNTAFSTMIFGMRGTTTSSTRTVDAVSYSSVTLRARSYSPHSFATRSMARQLVLAWFPPF